MNQDLLALAQQVDTQDERMTRIEAQLDTQDERMTRIEAQLAKLIELAQNNTPAPPARTEPEAPPRTESKRMTCSGRTAKGKACQSPFVESNGYCRAHQSQASGEAPKEPARSTTAAPVKARYSDFVAEIRNMGVNGELEVFGGCRRRSLRAALVAEHADGIRGQSWAQPASFTLDGMEFDWHPKDYPDYPHPRITRTR